MEKNNPFAQPREPNQSGLAARAHETLRCIFPEDFAPTPGNIFNAAGRTRAVAQLLFNAIRGESFVPAEQEEDNEILQGIADGLRVLAGIAEVQASVLWEVTLSGVDNDSARALLADTLAPKEADQDKEADR
ncbi:MAG: hypothetical protein OXH68_16980 [Gammaproteobacteria bacterium]|nr:hypothetical protein [Gammaproteobacteria bacterium]